MPRICEPLRKLQLPASREGHAALILERSLGLRLECVSVIYAWDSDAASVMIYGYLTERLGLSISYKRP